MGYGFGFALGAFTAPGWPRTLGAAGVLGALFLALPAQAQTWTEGEEPSPTPSSDAAPAEATEPAEGSSAETTSEDQTSSAGAPAEPDEGSPVQPEFSATEAACVPACRAGFTCVHGSCISACNPPCAKGESCSAEGKCELNHAQATPEMSYPEPASPRDPSAQRHDGFYLRLGFGFGVLGVGLDVDDDGRPGEASTRGGAILTEIALGGTVTDGFVLGLGYFGASVSGARDLRVDMGGTNPYRYEDRVDELGAGFIGPFVDYYFDPEKGFHVQAALGVGAVTYRRYFDDDSLDLGGLGALLGVGYEWWIGDQWSMGGLVRVLWIGANGKDPVDTQIDYSGSAIAPGILFTATYH